MSGIVYRETSYELIHASLKSTHLSLNDLHEKQEQFEIEERLC